MKIFILFFTLIFYLPVFLGWINILNRNNDLQEFFWPIIYFIKQNIYSQGQIPLWNNLFLAGTPLLPDPQSQIYYLPNILFLLFDIDQAFIVSMFLHSSLGGLGIYLCSRKIFRFSKFASFFAGAIYVTSPKMAGFLEAGHFGLINSYAWLPFVVLSTYKLTVEAKIKWIILLSFSLAAIFYSHIIIFSLTLFFTVGFFIFLTFQRKIIISKGTPFFILSLIITFGFISVQLLPALEWISGTTRFLLLENRDVYPKWTSIVEFLQVTLIPWSGGIKIFWSIDPEKFLSLGIIIILLALYGFITIKKSFRIALTCLTAMVILISLNNISPIYSFLISQDFYALMRVSTRVWFVEILVVVFLAGFGLNVLQKRSYKLSVLIGILAISEILFLSWTYLLKPISTPDFASSKVIEYIKSDKSRFRVFCTTRCLSQKKAAKAEMELLDGYSTIQQKNFFKEAWQLTGGYWNYYTLSIPPIGLYQFEKLQPDPVSLGKYNVKYIISPHKLLNNNFQLKKQVDNYLIYENSLFFERAYYQNDNQKPNSHAKIIKYSPNSITVDTSQKPSKRLILSEVYSPGWKAYLNGVEKIPVQETPNALRLIDLKKDTRFVDFKYQPNSFRIGASITTVTFVFLILMSLHFLKYNSKKMISLIRKNYILIAFLPLVIIRYLIIQSSSLTFFSDDAIYASFARTWHEGDWLHIFHPFWPPLYPLLSALTFNLVGGWEIALRLTSLLSSILLIIPTYYLLKYLTSKLTAILASVSLFLLTPIVQFSIFPLSDMLFAFLLVSALVTMYFALTFEGTKLFVSSAALFGLAYLTRSEGIMFFALSICYLGVYLIYRRVFRKMQLKKFKILLYFIIVFILVASPYVVAIRNQLGYWTLSQKFNAQIQQGHAFEFKNNTTWAQEIWSVKSPNYNSPYFNNAAGFALDHLYSLMNQFSKKAAKWKNLLISNFPIAFIATSVTGLILFNKKTLWADFFLIYILFFTIPVTIFSTSVIDIRYFLWSIPLIIILFYKALFILLQGLPIFVKSFTPFMLTTLIPVFSLQSLNVNSYSRNFTYTHNRPQILKVAEFLKQHSNGKELKVMTRHEGIEFYSRSVTIYMPQDSLNQVLEYAQNSKVDYIVAWNRELVQEKELFSLVNPNQTHEKLSKELTLETPEGDIIVFSLKPKR